MVIVVKMLFVTRVYILDEDVCFPVAYIIGSYFWAYPDHKTITINQQIPKFPA